MEQKIDCARDERIILAIEMLGYVPPPSVMRKLIQEIYRVTMSEYKISVNYLIFVGEGKIRDSGITQPRYILPSQNSTEEVIRASKNSLGFV